MKKAKIIYWVSTGLFTAVFATTSIMYLTHNSRMVDKFHELGYPLYVLNILGVAKLLGVIALLFPKYPRLKEWAYAGFVFDLIGALWSHAAVQGPEKAALLLTPITLVVISYATFHKLRSSPVQKPGT